MVCLDSDVLIDFFRNDKETVKKIIELKNRGLELATTTINSFELLKNSSKLNIEEISKIKSFLRDTLIFDFDFNSSIKAAEIFDYLKLKGEPLDIADIMIAAITITNNQSLLTRNIKHFSRIAELKLESFAQISPNL